MRLLFLQLLWWSKVVGEVEPERSTRWLEAGVAYAVEAELEEAEKAFEEAVKEETRNVTSVAKAWHGLAALRLIRGDVEKSAEAWKLGKKLDPKALPPLAELQLRGEKCGGLADVYWTAAFMAKTLASTETDVFEIHTTMGTLLEDSGGESAGTHFEKASKMRPNDAGLAFRTALFAPAVLSDDPTTVRQQLERRVDQLKKKPPALDRLDQLSWPGTFYIVYLGGRDARLMTKINDAYALAYPALGDSPLPRRSSSTTTRSTTRVGFVSSYFTRHSVCKLFCGVIRGLAEDPRFEVTVFSAAEKEDEWTEYALSSSSSKHVRLEKGALISNRHRALDSELDVLVFTDLGMDTRTTTWAAARLAPVQVLTWGHPHTSGLRAIDYFVSSDLYEDPLSDLKASYSEQVVRFESLSFFFRHPSEAGYLRQQHEVHSQLPLLLLDDDDESIHPAVVYLCPQSLPKFHPSFDHVIARLLALEPAAVVVVVYDPNKTLLLRRLRKRLDPKLDDPSRFVAIPHIRGSGFFALLKRATLLLDPFPFGGGVTTLEAMAVCKLVVTAPSLQTVPRLAAGMLQHAGLSRHLVVPDVDAYVATATHIARNVSYRLHLEDALCAANHHPDRSVFSSRPVIDEWAAFLRRVSLHP